MRRVPKTMSTQHPDNATQPEWAGGEAFTVDGEVREVVYAFRDLGVGEQMWDWEGKDIDPHVVRRLLEDYPEFFRERVLGRDVFLTYRIPNPDEEAGEKKRFAEALETIPLSYDVARNFYGEGAVPPVFEVILPLTRSSLQLLRTREYYRRIVVGKEDAVVIEGDVEVRRWIGEYHPKSIEVIPLVEDMGSISRLEDIVGDYVRAVQPPYLRVFIARSDPALNYGLVAAVILSKIALTKLRRVEEHGTRIFPIIGTGPPPFRGHLSPPNVERFLREYGGYWTVTIQSAFKYDYPPGEVRNAVARLERGLGVDTDPGCGDDALEVAKLLSADYATRLRGLHGLVNLVARAVPSRRRRRLHVGLFGYSRGVGGLKLPRAIRFTAALYSIGIPPEVLGISGVMSLSEEEQRLLDSCYANMVHDLSAAAERVSWENINMLVGDREVREKVTRPTGSEEGVMQVMEDLRVLEENFGIRTGPRSLGGYRYSNILNNILVSIAMGDIGEAMKEVVRAAVMRRFLG